ncbi:MAG TPA: hypothetical protein DD671_09770, partial [Balneolaceae bacterium]|nr:hypothetical protein [Balneolaceae bacterium]
MKISATISKIYSSFSATILICLLALSLAPADLFAQTTVTVQGIVELEGETDYGGVEVYFDPQSPSAAEKTVTTNSDGTWTANSVNVGIYTVRFSKEGFVPSRIPDIFIDKDSVLTTQIMKVGGLKNISGDISGTLYSDTLYVVTDDIVVAAGSSLEIEAGTEVRFDQETGLRINGGTLAINGTATDSVLFSSNADIPDFGDWKGIYFNGGTNHILSHLTIDRALNAISVGDSTGTQGITNSLFDFIRIQNTSLRQLPFRLNGSENVVSNSTIDTKESYNIQISGANNSLEGNTFKNGFERSVYVSYWVETGENNFEFKNNTIQNYTGTAIYGNGSNINIEANTISTIHRNEIAIQVGGDSTQVINNDISVLGGSRTDEDRLKMISISRGNIVNNRLTIAYEGTEDSYTYGHVFSSNGGVIRDNELLVNTDRRLYYFGILHVNNVKVISNDFQIFARYMYGGRTSAMDVSLSDRVYNSEIRNNTFHYEATSSSGAYMGFYFRNSRVEDNEFSFLNSGDRNGVIVSENSTFRRNTISKTFYSNWVTANLSYKYAIRTNGSSIIQNNVIYNERGIYAEGLDRNGEISYNEIHNTIGNERLGIHVTGASEADVVNNTLVMSDSTGTGTGILVDNNSSIDVQNNHIQNFATGITINSVNNIPSFNNLYQNTAAFSGSELPSQIGTFSTTNHQGSSSDIYFNINVDPQFINPADSNYALQTSSPLVDAGSDKLSDADGTRSDIGANPFDYGNPKNLRAAETGEASITLSFDPVLRDSVSGYRIIGGTNPASLSEMSLVTDPVANNVVLTGLTNNETYYLIAKAVFYNTESIPTDTVTAIPGTASFTVSSDSLIYVLSDTDTSKTISYQIANTGTKDFSVAGEISSPPDFASVGNSFNTQFDYNYDINYSLPSALSSEDVLYMQVSGEIHRCCGSTYRWDAQNYIGTSSDSSFYQPELLINGKVVTAL